MGSYETLSSSTSFANAGDASMANDPAAPRRAVLIQSLRFNLVLRVVKPRWSADGMLQSAGVRCEQSSRGDRVTADESIPSKLRFHDIARDTEQSRSEHLIAAAVRPRTSHEKLFDSGEELQLL